MNSEFPDSLLKLMSQLKVERDDEQEGKEETEEVEEWCNQFAEDDQDYEQSWGEESEESEFDFDSQSECTLSVIIVNQYEHSYL